MSEYKISALNIHPVKSLGPVSLSEVEIDRFGLRFDRRFMLVDDAGRFITQRKYSALAKVSASFDGSTLNISGEGIPEISFSISEFSKEADVCVWSDEVGALTVQDRRTQVISDYLGVNVALAYMPDSTFRQVDREFFAESQQVSFADGFPILLTNQASLDDLNSRLEVPVGMNRFRPNIVLEGDIPFQEDSWKRIAIGEIEFALVKPCSRCIMTCIDEHGEIGKEPLKTLAKYRKNDFGVCFGQNMVQLNTGKISLDDKLRVIEVLEEG